MGNRFVDMGALAILTTAITAVVLAIIFAPSTPAPAPTSATPPAVVYGPDELGIVCLAYGQRTETLRCIATRTFVVPVPLEDATP